VGSGLTHKHYTRLERPVRNEHSLGFFVSDQEIKIYHIGNGLSFKTSQIAFRNKGNSGKPMLFSGTSWQHKSLIYYHYFYAVNIKRNSKKNKIVFSLLFTVVIHKNKGY